MIGTMSGRDGAAILSSHHGIAFIASRSNRQGLISWLTWLAKFCVHTGPMGQSRMFGRPFGQATQVKLGCDLHQMKRVNPLALRYQLYIISLKGIPLKGASHSRSDRLDRPGY